MITIKCETYFVSEETGYSAWVHIGSVDKPSEGFAHHAGYRHLEKCAIAAAASEAEQFVKAYRLAGVEFEVVKD